MARFKIDDMMLLGFGIGAAAGLLLKQRNVIVPFVKLSRPDRFLGDPEVEIEIGGKRTHARLDSGNEGDLMLLKSTSALSEIKRKFHPMSSPIYDSFQNLRNPPAYNIPLTIIGANQNITINAPTMLAEDVNPGLDNDIIPVHLFLKYYAISFFPNHARFTPYPYIPNPQAVSIPRNTKSLVPFIQAAVNGVPDHF